MKLYRIENVRIAVEADADSVFIRRIHGIIKNWEADGSKELSGVSLSSVHIAKEKATFCCSGSYFSKLGECFVMEVFANNDQTKRYF